MNELNPNLNKANKEVTMELNFIKSGDYYIPDIKLKNPNIRLGKWGRMRREYLRQAHPIVFSEMVLSETLYEHCAEIEATAKKRMDVILPQLMKYYGVTEQLKAENQIEWVRQMTACVAQAPSRVAPQRRRASSSTSGRMPSTPNLPSLPGWRLRRSFPAISGT